MYFRDYNILSQLNPLRYFWFSWVRSIYTCIMKLRLWGCSYNADMKNFISLAIPIKQWAEFTDVSFCCCFLVFICRKRSYTRYSGSGIAKFHIFHIDGEKMFEHSQKLHNYPIIFLEEKLFNLKLTFFCLNHSFQFYFSFIKTKFTSL